jgi:hypothetical protein
MTQLSPTNTSRLVCGVMGRVACLARLESHCPNLGEMVVVVCTTVRTCPAHATVSSTLFAAPGSYHASNKQTPIP